MATKKEVKSKAKPKPKKDEPKKMGRPECRPYDPEIGDIICDEISTCSDGIRKILARHPGFPEFKTIMKWRIKNNDFGQQYARAKQIQAEIIFAEEIIEIADDSSLDTTTNDKGREVCDNEWVARSKLRIDSRKWIASRLAPKIYGDKTINENHNFNHEKSLKDLDDDE